MVKYTRYSYGYPTIWSHWMYPPNGVSTMQYMKIAANGYWTAQKSNFKMTWPVWATMAGLTVLAYKISFDWAVGGKFNKSLRSDTGNWLYGPPDPKMVEERRVDKIMHAPHL